VDLFVTAFSAQESLKVSRELFNTSRRAKDISERAYSESLLRSVDIQSARREFFDAEIDLHRKTSEFEIARAAALIRVTAKPEKSKTSESEHLNSAHVPIATPINVSDFEFASPLTAELLEEIKSVTSLSNPSALKELENSQEIQEMRLQLQAQREALIRELSRNKSNIQAGLLGSTRQGVSPSQQDFVRFQDDSVGVFLKLELPLSANLSDKIAIERHKTILAEQRLLSTQRRLSTESVELYQRVLFNLKANELSIKKMEQDQLRLLRAQELLRAGRIQFDEYFRYQSAYFSERQFQIELIKQLIVDFSRLTRILGKLPSFCQSLNEVLK
jgi:outer membrane protein TolC